MNIKGIIIFGIAFAITIILISMFAFAIGNKPETIKSYPIRRKNAMTYQDIEKIFESMKKDHLRKND